MFKQIPAVSVSMRKIEKPHFPAACRAHRACLMPLGCCRGWRTEKNHTLKSCPLRFLNGKEKEKWRTQIQCLQSLSRPLSGLWRSHHHLMKLNSTSESLRLASVFLIDHLFSPSVWAPFSPPGWLAFAHHILSSASPRWNQVPFWG